MIGLLQRVSEASVAVEGRTVAAIGPGLLVLVGVERGDGTSQARRLLQRLLACRVFEDDAGRMNRSLADTGGDLLLVPQFTLAADTRKGTRPSFAPAAEPALGRELFDDFCACATGEHLGRVARGAFGAHMRVALVNDGPVTLWLQVPAGRERAP